MQVCQLGCASLLPIPTYRDTADRETSYIGAQTPMKNTEGDVWEMIWMEKCAAVVVLCDFVEGKDVSRQTTFKHSVQLPSFHE